MTLYLITTVFVVIFCLGLGIFIFLKNKKEKSNILFSLFLIGLGSWALGDIFVINPPSHYFTPLSWIKLTYIGAALTPCLYFHFVTEFTKKTIKKVILQIQYGLGALYVLAMLFTPLFFVSAHYIAPTNHLKVVFGPIYYLFLANCIFGTALGVLFAFQTFKTSSGALKEQMRYFLVGTILIVIAAILCTLITTIGMSIRLDNLFGTAYITLIAFAITKKNLMDIKVVITKTIAIGITSCLYIGAFLIIYAFYFHSFSQKIEPSFIIFSSAFLILTALTFEKLKLTCITTSQKLFIKGQYTTNDILLNISKNLYQVQDHKTIFSLIAKECQHSMELQNVHLVLPKSPIEWEITDTFTNNEDSISSNAPLLTFFNNTTSSVLYSDLSPKLTQDLPAFSKKTLVIPVHSKNTLLCLFFFGPKLSETPFNDSDKTLLAAICHEIVAVFENVRQLEEHATKLAFINTRLESRVSQQNKAINEKTRMDKDLKLAHSVQNRLIPKTTPKIQNYHFEAEFIPAQILGGDFYSFRPYSNGTIGIIVADAVGKGIQAALMMSHFKNLEEDYVVEGLSPKEVLTQLNLLIHHSTIYHNALPLLYGILDPINHIFTYANAGLEPGLLYSNTSFKLLPVNNPPLGLDLTIQFEETSIELKDGDILTFFTDGLIEARNTERKSFGIEKIQDVIREYHYTQHIHPETFTSRMRNAWKTFQNPEDIDLDDMTVLMIQHQAVKYVKIRNS